MNDATLNRLNIKWEHEKLARFGCKETGTWDDAEYRGERYVHWGSSDEGTEELQAMVARWTIHIELGKLAARVLCEYLDSRIHCFDNTQKMHPTNRARVDRGMMTELAEWQDRQLAPVLEKYTVEHSRDGNVCHAHVFHGKTEEPFARMSVSEIKDVYLAACASIVHLNITYIAGYEDEREAMETVYERHLDTSLVHECNKKYCQTSKRIARAVTVFKFTRVVVSRTSRDSRRNTSAAATQTVRTTSAQRSRRASRRGRHGKPHRLCRRPEACKEARHEHITREAWLRVMQGAGVVLFHEPL